MNRFVVDASVAVKWLVPEAGTDEAVALLEGCRLIAPHLIFAECANVLWKKVSRRNLTVEEALLAADVLEHFDLAIHPMGALVTAATQLAIDLDHPAYDCFYLALAAREGCLFVTADMRLIAKLSRSKSISAPPLSIAEAATLTHPASPP